MIRFFLAAWLSFMLPAASQARPVQVTSGEHDGFTRLVLDYGRIVDWRLGRTTDGYELQLSNTASAYDLTGVYDLIGRGRLASVWVDPPSGALRIGIGCACHAQPFEFRPGIVVIDLKDGPAPTGSSFETALTGEPLATLAPRPVQRPRARSTRITAPSGGNGGYSWTSEFLKPDPTLEATENTPERPTLVGPNPGLQPLRDDLLDQLSRGASRGVVDLSLPAPLQTASPQTDSVQIRITDLPGIRIDDDTSPPTGLRERGEPCITDDKLDISSWGTDRPVSEQMAGAMTGLIGEFDAPDPDAELRAVRFMLFLGFGAEARQILALRSAPGPDEGILTSLAHTLDDTLDPAPAFAGMAACDTAAALWAVLGEDTQPRGKTVDRASVLRAFSTLPVHLRRLLGPSLADHFLALDDASAVEAVRQAIKRAPGESGPEVTLMEARVDLEGGDPGRAEQRLQPLITSSGPATSEALIAQVDTHLARRAPIEPARIIALEALLHERKEGPDAERFAVALTKARALAGDFEQAFADLADVPAAKPAVWSLLAEIGPDSALLTHAIVSPGRAPAVSGPVASRLARRLSDLGFAAQAGDWMLHVPDADPELGARIALQTGDARTALRLIAGSEDPELASLRSDALYKLADEAALAAVLAESGDDEARWRAVSRARDWPQLAVSGPAHLQVLAAAAIGAAPLDPAVEGALSKGQNLLDASVQTRLDIENLLATVAGPIPDL